MSNNQNQSITPLPLEEEQALIREAQDGSEGAMTALLGLYDPAIKNAASKFRVEDTYNEDALQEARIAFIMAVKEHDFDKAPRLSRYIHAAIRNHMTETMTDTASAWGIPARTARLFYQILRKADGDVNAGADLTEEFEMARSTFLEIASILHTGSLQDRDETGVPLVETAHPVGRTRDEDAYDTLDRSLLAHSLMGEIDDPAALTIVRLAYGFDDVTLDGALIDPTVSDAVIAQAMPFPTEKGTGWSRATVQRKRTAALALMRDKYTDTEKEN